ncbi:hypothetical protein V865_002325 [Kwoniella europaea PYCC6329]|uniref:Peptidase S7 domain-containing protein n=1 Tax=Kwoniella europaea PYCC6329 TaxID=1423913 RepID=A0AAX4KCP7_9TREE
MSETPPSNNSVSSTEASRATATMTTPTHLNRSSYYQSGSISIESDHFDLSDLSISPPTELELYAGYYHGVPTCPKLLARSGDDNWSQPRSTLDIGYPEPKVLAPVDAAHPITAIWDIPLGEELLQTLDRILPTANSIDVLKVCYEFEVESANPVIWIGVTPNTATSTIAKGVVKSCIALLEKYGMLDVQVEIKESTVSLLALNRLYDPLNLPVATQEITRQFSASLGLAITTRAKPFVFGSSAFFVRDRLDKTDTIMLLTGQHVISGTTNINGYNAYVKLPSDKDGIIKPKYVESEIDKAPPTDVVIINQHIIKKAQTALHTKIQRKSSDVEKGKVAVDAALSSDRAIRTKLELELAELDLKALEATEKDLLESWFSPGQNVIGQVFCFPQKRYNVGDKGYTEDFAVIRLDSRRLPRSIHNSLDLSSEASYDYAAYDDHAPFLAIPDPGFLRVEGMLNEHDLRQPLSVLCYGAASGLKRGRSLSVMSMVKPYGEDGQKRIEGYTRTWSREWGIVAIKKDGPAPFSVPGDSGSGVIARDGRAGGILTGGSGAGNGPPEAEGKDVTYVTPIYWILERMKEYGFRDPQLL